MPNGQYIYDKDSIYRYLGRESDKINVIYVRVSTTKQKQDLLNQIENLEKFCFSNGYVIHRTFKDVAKRKEFYELLDLVMNEQVSRVFIQTKSIISYEFEILNYIFTKIGTEIVVINQSEALDEKEL